jgi:Protein of unknown function (DUF1553)/Protein of unknown function (DUF1549)/Planctomycete cytochrome C
MRFAIPILLLVSVRAQAESPDFAKDVRPILANHCFKCHGPDAAARKAKLRLDTAEGAKAALGEVVNRIASKDDDQVMPPPHVKKPLSDKQKQIIKDWIAAGAKYEQHWAFIAPKKTFSGEAKPSAGASPIDAFIRSKLTASGLKPSQPADKATLIRRVSLDLIGLPPTPKEVEDFVKDISPDAYEKLVDRLLASPHYGERWARKWLDLARYADTNGYEKDRPRIVWPYRDWVIRALNADMPFDRFTIEQIAGDMLPNAISDQIVATGFHRNTMLNEEGGIDPLEFRYYAVVDRINTTATTWLGLTLGCAQCHTHKFDPIPHTDYFKMFAFLNNAEEPEFEVYSSQQLFKRFEIDRDVSELELKTLRLIDKELGKEKYLAWQKSERDQLIDWHFVKPTKSESGPTKLKQLDDGSLLALGDPTKEDVYQLEFADWPTGVTAIRLEALTDPSLPANGPGRAFYEGPKGDFLLTDIRLSVNGTPVRFADASDSFAGAKSAAKKAFDDNLQTGWAGRGPGQSSHAIFNLAKPTTGKTANLSLRFERHYSASLGRFRVSVTTATGKVVARDLSVDAEEALRIDDAKQNARQGLALFREYLRLSPELKTQREAIEKLRKEIPQGPRTLVMAERPEEHPRKTFRHHRGEFLQPAEEVQPGGLSILHPVPAGAKPDRLTFAKWLVSKENPLVARVAVNRAWAAFFGRGIVRTVDDFGYQGDMPTHPELLDWLAVEFTDNGWSMKKLHKQIVTSETYRQSSKVQPDHLTKDPENKLLARFPRVRLDAEVIRDSALKASGLLSAKIGGPSVFPPQPPGVQDTAYGGAAWKPSTGEDRHRRSLYTYTKRTAPFALTATFDGPSGEACVAKREVSNTSLQALTLLNDPSMMEAASALGKAIAAEKGTAKEKAERIVRRCLARSATDNEMSVLAKFADGVKGDEAAKWTAVARAVMNLDEFVTKE